jgi:hypothetical protein
VDPSFSHADEEEISPLSPKKRPKDHEDPSVQDPEDEDPNNASVKVDHIHVAVEEEQKVDKEEEAKISAMVNVDLTPQEEKDRVDRINKNQQLLKELMGESGEDNPESIEHDMEVARAMTMKGPAQTEEPMVVVNLSDEEDPSQRSGVQSDIDNIQTTVKLNPDRKATYKMRRKDEKSGESSYQDFVQQKTIIKGKV